MKIFKDRNNPFYNVKAKILGNAITVLDDKEYYYEFKIINDEAIIKYSDLKYIEDATRFFNANNKYIYKYSTLDNSFNQEFDKVFTFKLPISSIQPSEFFIDEDRLLEIEDNLDEDRIIIPVAIINDEYVSLDGHHRLAAMQNNYHKLVSVYMDDYKPEVLDFIYIAKEQNIRSIKQMPHLSHEEYKNIWEGFLKDYNNNR